ncbi:hypothetical protein PQ465_14180 [Sphingobacterium oryzagri]|uniref:Outer membrane protein beta-barrel domain-containing protein n=1 Tax=Sphingobacterium oryzagri TaxID=3025669 RepID=A0ABY7WGP9_9SPHI|nr:hypothetical protein [Sphingobacterium sp. KACC 22765]WDF67450.1 hypothetical protein PQ465_14180 [Sphingobacterium sp. KACC 22765]
MKKILLTLTALAGLSTLSYAQEFGFQKGDILLEGNVSLNTLKREYELSASKLTMTNLALRPKAGYFVADKWVLGVDLGYELSRTASLYENMSSVKSSAHRYRFGGFGRYYFWDLGERFKTFTELGAYYGFDRNENYDLVDARINRYGANAGIGANYFLTRRVAIGYSFTDLISFDTDRPDLDNADATKRFRVNLNSFSNFLQSGFFSLTFKL